MSEFPIYVTWLIHCTKARLYSLCYFLKYIEISWFVSGNSKETKEKEKDETTSNPEGEEAVASKPQSAGANVRDAAQRILVLCQKGEWAPVDQVLKSMEKAIANSGDEANTVPLAGVQDLVSNMK